MPRDGAIVFGDLDSKLPVVRVTCSQCDRDLLIIAMFTFYGLVYVGIAYLSARLVMAVL